MSNKYISYMLLMRRKMVVAKEREERVKVCHRTEGGVGGEGR